MGTQKDRRKGEEQEQEKKRSFRQPTFKTMKTVSWTAGLTAPSYCFFFPWGRGVVTSEKPKSPKSIDLPRQEWDATVATSRL